MRTIDPDTCADCGVLHQLHELETYETYQGEN